MAIKIIGYFEFDTEDIVGRCPRCYGDLFNAPELATLLELSEEQLKKIESGIWQIVYCPACGFVDLWETPLS